MTREVENIFATPEGDEKLVVIPPNYMEEGVVPICIRTTDDRGNPVFRGWIEAVRPMAGQLRFMAKTIIQDVWRISELTEGSVHTLSAKHGERMGRRPQYSIFRDATWRARNLAKGGRGSHDFQREVELPDRVRALLRDPYDLVKAFENYELFTRLEKELRAMGLDDTLQMMQMYLSDSDDEIPEVFGAAAGAMGYRAKNTLFQRFRRRMRNTLKLLSEQVDKPAA